MKKRFWRIPASILLLAGIAVVIIWQLGFFYQKEPVSFSEHPLTSLMKETVAEKQRFTKPAAAEIQSGTLKLLRDEVGSAPYVASWYLLSGTVSTQPALCSNVYLCRDQIALVRSYVSLGKKSEARELLQAIYEDFLGEDGFLQASMTAEELGITSKIPTDDIYDTIANMESSVGIGLLYIDAYLHYYEKWGLSEDWENIKIRAAELCPPGEIFEENVPFFQADIAARPVDEVNPEIPLPSETNIVPFAGTPISSLSLETLRILSEIENAYEADYEKARNIVEGAQISAEVPLFAAFYSEDSYFYFVGNIPSARTKDSLFVMLTLAEENKLGDREKLWIKNQMYTMEGFSESYDIFSGQATGSSARAEVYALVLQIARYVGDDAMYALAYERLQRFFAVAEGSAARGTLFQTTEDNRILIRACDNLQAVIGISE